MNRADVIEPDGIISWDDIQSEPEIVDSPNATVPEQLSIAIRNLDNAIGSIDEYGRRHVPSAGSCYPYELTVRPAGHAHQFATLDFVRRNVHLNMDDLECWDVDGFTFELVGRPWLSLRKYGKRGYLYHLLDVGHATANLSLTFGLNERAVSGVEKTKNARFRSLVAQGNIASISGSSTHANGWTAVNRPHFTMPEGNIFESVVNELLPEAYQILHAPHFSEKSAMQLKKAIPSRRSAAGFTQIDRSDAVLQAVTFFEETIAELRDSLPARTPSYQVFYNDGQHDKQLAHALRGQRQLMNAHAYLVMSVPIENRASPIGGEVQELVAMCGIFGQIAYLSATIFDVGVTAIGGIDPDSWVRLCEPDGEVVYVIALGQAIGGVKADRYAPAGAHRDVSKQL